MIRQLAIVILWLAGTCASAASNSTDASLSRGRMFRVLHEHLRGLLKLVRLKVLPESYKKIALRSWAAVNARYVKDGVVTGVSAGTDPQPLDG